MILLFLVVIAFCVPAGDLHARRALRRTVVRTPEAIPEKAPEPRPTVNVDQLSGQYHDIYLLAEEGNRQAEEIRRAAEREKQAVDNKVKRHKSRIERRREEVLRRDAEEQARLEEKARKEKEELDRKLAAEEEATRRASEKKIAEMKVILEQEVQSDKAAGRTEITKEWRREMLRDFEKNSGFIRQVVMEGEVVRVERQNFTVLFTKQQQWFSEKVEAAQFFFDEAYNAVVAKRNAVIAVVDAQRQADDLILDLVQEYHFPAKVQAQLRLMALYEINNHIQNTPNPSVFLPADVIENLVQKISIDVAPGQREIKIINQKEKVASLTARITELEKKLASEEEASKAAMESSEQVNDLHDRLVLLKKEREDLLGKMNDQEALHAKERGSLVEVLEQKAKEKAELEVQLAQVAEHMKVLTSRSQSCLKQLASKLSDKEVTERELRDAVEVKARKQAELEVSLARVNEQISQLRRTSAEVVTVLTDQVNTLQDRCKVLGQLFEEKQRESIELELQVRSASDIHGKVVQEASAVADALTQVQQERDEYRQQLSRLKEKQIKYRAEIGSLHEAVAELAEKNKSVSLSAETFQQKAIDLTEKSQRETTMLMELLQLQQKELNERHAAYGEMARLQETLEAIRHERAEDSRRSAAHAHLLTQMAAFGDKLLVDYNRLHGAAQNVRDVHQQLADLLAALRDSQQEPDHVDVLRSLEIALDLLKETSSDITIAERKVQDHDPIIPTAEDIEKTVEDMRAEAAQVTAAQSPHVVTIEVTAAAPMESLTIPTPIAFATHPPEAGDFTVDLFAVHQASGVLLPVGPQ